MIEPLTCADGRVSIRIGDCRESVRAMPEQSVHCCVTSPPYFGLRDYGHAGQIGLEPTPAEFVAALVDVFREVRRVLRDDGTVWVNLGDSYVSTAPGAVNAPQAKGSATAAGQWANPRPDLRKTRLKPKDLIGIPWRVAFALQDDGWYLRQDIIWHKPNPMPESVRDRCTKAHEYVFLLTKGPRYYCDMEAIRDPVTESTVARVNQAGWAQQSGSDRVPGKTNGPMKAVVRGIGAPPVGDGRKALRADIESRHRASIPGGQSMQAAPDGTRNKRSVWTVPSQPYSGAHFATYPPKLIEPCILAGCPKGGTVLDPFGGAGTTGLVAARHGRNAVLCELNPTYAEIARDRIAAEWREPPPAEAQDFGPLFAGAHE